ncbi:MAG: ATP synthase F1 subunit gamma [Clostridiales bacterium]|nr:ATP synthase F1 subunit gamma [Clostridiales bacterium]
MANMREIKLRIKSIKETRQITKAMKLISAAKLKRARQQLERTYPYFSKVEETIADILLHSGDVESKFFDTRTTKESKKTAFIILTGDKGLAGGYNINLFKLAEREIAKYDNPLLFVAGHMGRNYFKRKKYNMYEDFDYPVQNPSIYRAIEMTDIILKQFILGEIDEVYMIYTLSVSTMRLEPRMMKVLPLNLQELRKDIGLEDETAPKPDMMLNYEPSPLAVLDVLIPKYVKGIMYGTLVEAFTSEQSARMSAMDSATSNANEMLQSLNLFYNRARQAAITQEITEIVGGAETLQ